MVFIRCRSGIKEPHLLNLPMMEFTILDRTFLGLVDSTSERTLAGPDLIKYLDETDTGFAVCPIADSILYSRFGNILPRRGAEVDLTWKYQSRIEKMPIMYIPELSCELVIGRDFLRRTDILLNFAAYGWAYAAAPTKLFSFENICKCCNLTPAWRLFIDKCHPDRLKLPESAYRLPARAVERRISQASFNENEYTDANRQISNDQLMETMTLYRSVQSADETDARTTESQPISSSTENEEILKTIFRKLSQDTLDIINYIYDILDTHVTTENQYKLNQHIKDLLAQHRSANRELMMLDEK